MNRLRLFLLLPLIALVFVLPAHAARQKPTRPSAASKAENGTCKGYIVMDAASGKILIEENADVVSPPASMTKLMTFAVLADKLQSGALTLDTPVKIENEDSQMGGTQAYLDPRETFPVEELIYAMMIQSANDAAHALARTAAGSRAAFVEQMNAKAREIGMTHSTFRTPHGLTSKRQSINEGDLTSPRDYALLCRYLIQHTDVTKYTSVRTREFGPNRAKGPMRMENHNKLLGKTSGVDGLKTGYTENAGYCLSATAERNGRRVIVVIMGCFGGKDREIDKGKSRDLKAIDLIERGFNQLATSGAAMVAPAAYTAPIFSKPTAPATKPTPMGKASAKKAAAPAEAPTPVEQAPLAAPAAEVSPVSAASSPVAPAAESSNAAAPAVKFELPAKKKP